MLKMFRQPAQIYQNVISWINKFKGEEVLFWLMDQRYRLLTYSLVLWTWMAFLFLLILFHFRNNLVNEVMKMNSILVILLSLLLFFVIVLMVLPIFFRVNNRPPQKIDPEVRKNPSDDSVGNNFLVQNHRIDLNAGNAKSLNVLCKSLLKNLANYTEAGAAAFYVLDSGEYRLVSCFAANYSQLPKKFVPGEGMIGQVATDGKMVLLRNINSGILKIISGTGSSLPRFLLFLPFVFQQNVLAVAELAMFKDLDDSKMHELEAFLPKAAMQLKGLMEKNEQN